MSVFDTLAKQATVEAPPIIQPIEKPTEKSTLSIFDQLAGKQTGGQESGTPIPKPKERTFGGFVGNVGQNIIDLATGTVKAIASPIETGKGLATLAAGTISSLVPDRFQTQKSPEIQQAEELAGAVGNVLKEHIKDPLGTLYEHPVDVLSILSPALQASGKVAKIGGLSRTANILTKTGNAIEPTQVITTPIKVAGKIATNIKPLKNLPVNLYASALKPKLPKGKDTLENVIKTVESNLSKERVISQKVWRKTQKEINRYGDDIKKVIDQGTAKGDIINIDDITSNLDNLVNDTAFADFRPDLLEKAVARTKKALTDYHGIRQGGFLTPKEVQRLKTRQWSSVEKQFGELNVAYKADIQKSLGHGAKKSLETLYPELKNLNLKQGELLEFNRHLEKSLKSHLLSDEVRNLAFIIKAIVDNPTAKSKVAIWLNRAKKGNPLSNPKALEKNLLIQLGRIEGAGKLKQERPEGSQPTLGGQ